jgi:hypothetical protein
MRPEAVPADRCGVASRLRFLLGCILAAGFLTGLAEGYLRLFPPKDLCPYLGKASPLRGIYEADADFGVSYRSWEAFREDNAERLTAYLPWEASSAAPPVWAFFGNSFVQAPGMLADHARAGVPGRRIFNLGRNEPLPIRLAQIKLLLEHGFEPERIFIALMPVDVILLGEQPLATYQVTANGALTYRPRQPAGPLGWLIGRSRLALTAWVRKGQQRGNPQFQAGKLYEGVGETLQRDLHFLFGNLARVAREHHVPVTILLIPAYHQIRCGACCGFQDALGPMFRELGFDVFDPRDAFRQQADLDALFIPDRHFSPLGNQILLRELLQHIRGQEALTRASEETRRP